MFGGIVRLCLRSLTCPLLVQMFCKNSCKNRFRLIHRGYRSIRLYRCRSSAKAEIEFWGRIWKPNFGGFQLEKELFEELDCLSCGTKDACRSEWDGSTDFDRSLKAEEA